MLTITDQPVANQLEALTNLKRDDINQFQSEMVYTGLDDTLRGIIETLQDGDGQKAAGELKNLAQAIQQDDSEAGEGLREEAKKLGFTQWCDQLAARLEQAA